MLLSRIAELARSLDTTSFVVNMPDPVLIPGDAFGALERGATFDTPESGSSIEPFKIQKTRRLAAEETALDFVPSPLEEALEGAVAEATPPSGVVKMNPAVLFVKKSDRNPFQQMITIGRSPNNDIILEDKGVSKVHAYFVRTGFRWWFHDQASTNGTFLDESRVPPTGVPLSDGAKIGIGPRFRYSFFTARGLHKFLTGCR